MYSIFVKYGVGGGGIKKRPHEAVSFLSVNYNGPKIAKLMLPCLREQTGSTAPRVRISSIAAIFFWGLFAGVPVESSSFEFNYRRGIDLLSEVSTNITY
jgi:hypothetical protein